MSKSSIKNVLLKTSAATDVLSSGRIISITGLDPIERPAILGMVEMVSRAEVVQVAKAGGDSYTPTASTVYKILAGDYETHREGFTRPLKQYSYTTPATITALGATAALQREAIHAKLITQMNADKTANFTAATAATGTGINITDTAGYYPPRKQGINDRKGATRIICVTNPDGSGFTSGNASLSITTAAVYSVGVGTVLKGNAPVIDAMHGNLISGTFYAPVTTTGASADDNQNYTAFAIVSLTRVSVMNITGQLAFQLKEQMVWVDNGTGSSTTNLTGFLAFQKRMHVLFSDAYRNDGTSYIEHFEDPLVMVSAAGAAVTGVDTAANIISTKWNNHTQTIIGTSTIKVPTLGTGGLLLELDATATEGAEYTPGLNDTCAQKFVVGKQEFSIYAKIKGTTVANCTIILGFRTKAAYNATLGSYTNMAAIGLNGAAVTTYGTLASAAQVVTAAGVNAVDATWFDLDVKVGIDGIVTAWYNGTAYPIYSVGTTPLVLAAATEVVPFLRHTNLNSAAGVPNIKTLIAVPTKDWRK